MVIYLYSEHEYDYISGKHSFWIFGFWTELLESPAKGGGGCKEASSPSWKGAQFQTLERTGRMKNPSGPAFGIRCPIGISQCHTDKAQEELGGGIWCNKTTHGILFSRR